MQCHLTFSVLFSSIKICCVYPLADLITLSLKNAASDDTLSYEKHLVKSMNKLSPVLRV